MKCFYINYFASRPLKEEFRNKIRVFMTFNKRYSIPMMESTNDPSPTVKKN